jgi:hypothetical protein
MIVLLRRFAMRSALPTVVLAAVVFAGCDAGAKTQAGNSYAANTSSAATGAAGNGSAGAATAGAAPHAIPPGSSAPTPSPVAVESVAAAEEARYRTLTIPAGTTLRLALQTGVSSKHSSVEDRVNATLRRALVVNGVAVVPAGAAVSGYVTEATRSGRVKGRARVAVRFTSLRASDGEHDIRTATISRQAPGTKKKDAVKIGVGAGAGAVVGAIAGGKKGAAIGSAVGGAGGTGVVLATRGDEVALGPGTVVTTRLTAPLDVRVRVP